MIVGIDAANIRGGGGVTHLVELLRSATPSEHGFSRVILWGGRSTLDRIDDRDWLIKSHQPMLDKGFVFRIWWQRFRLSQLARASDCNVLYIPGGSFMGAFKPIVAFSQNLLPFEWREFRRYGWSLVTAKMMLLRWTQSRTFRHADGLILLTAYAQAAVMRVTRTKAPRMTIIPHGVDPRFSKSPREQRPLDAYSLDHPLRILYVSVVDVYKHQWHVAEAVASLRASGIPVALDLVGPAYPPALERLRDTQEEIDPSERFVRYLGPIPHGILHEWYSQADVCLFASSCETFGQILIEAMTAGLPIACSNRSAMPELLGDAGVYFDPEDPDDIARAVSELIASAELRHQLASASFARAQVYSWRRCADETFRFLAEVAVSNEKS